MVIVESISTQRRSIWIRGSLCHVPLCKLCLCESSAKWKPCSHSSLCICLPKEGPLWYINMLLLKNNLIGISGKDRGETVESLFLIFFSLTSEFYSMFLPEGIWRMKDWEIQFRQFKCSEPYFVQLPPLAAASTVEISASLENMQVLFSVSDLYSSLNSSSVYKSPPKNLRVYKCNHNMSSN